MSSEASTRVCPICGGALLATDVITRDRQYPTPGEFAVEECPHCNLGITAPQLTDEELVPHYGAGYSGYARSTSGFRAWQRRRRMDRRPFHNLPAGEGKRLLDVGCGSGQIGIELLEAGWKVCGVDPSHEAVATANDFGLDARTGDISAWRGENFDAVLFHHSLEHVPEPVQALRQAGELVSARNGIIAVAVPNWNGPLRRRFGANWFQLDVPRHRWHFTPTALKRAVEAAGLRTEDVGTTASIESFVGSTGYLLLGQRRLPKHFIDAGMSLLFPVERLLGRADTAYIVARPTVFPAASG